MLIVELDVKLVEDWKASKKLCKSSTPNNKLGASALASCKSCLLYTSPSPRDGLLSRMPSSA